MKNFRDLQVWHKAHSLTLASYRITSTFPKQEMYGLTSQMRRCLPRQSLPISRRDAASVGTANFYRFLNTAMGSASELEYHFLLARDLGFMRRREAIDF